MLLLLHDDIITLILNNLCCKDILNFSLINKKFKYLTRENARNITQIIYNNIPNYLNAKSIKIMNEKNLLIENFKNYENITFENVIISNINILNNNNNIKYIKLFNTNLISYFNPINYISLTSLILINNNSSIKIYNENNNVNINKFFNNLIKLSKLNTLYLENIFNNDINISDDICKLTSLTNLTSLGLCNIQKNICNEYNFLENMTKLKKLYLNNYYTDVKFKAPIFLNELYIKYAFNKRPLLNYADYYLLHFNLMQPFLNIKLIDISNTNYLYTDLIITIIKNYYRTLEKLYVNNSNIGDLIIFNLSEYILKKIPSLSLDIYLKYNKFNNDSLIRLYNSSNININVSKHDMCVNNFNIKNYNRIIVK